MGNRFTAKCNNIAELYAKNTALLKEDEGGAGNQNAINLAKGIGRIGYNTYKYFFTLKTFINNASKEVKSIGNEWSNLYAHIYNSRLTKAQQITAINNIPLQKRANLEERVQTLNTKLDKWRKVLDQLIQTKRVKNYKAQLDIISQNLQAARAGDMSKRAK